MSQLATVTPLPSRSVNAIVGANVKIIAGLRGVAQNELADLIGTTQSSMSRRINGSTDWSPDEIQTVATHLSVTVGRLFQKLPDLDSNQEPAGSQTALRNNVTPLISRHSNRPVKQPTKQVRESHNAVVTVLRNPA